MVTKAKKALLASLAAFLCVMLTVFGLGTASIFAHKTANAADEAKIVVNGTEYATFEEARDKATPDGDEVITYTVFGKNTVSSTDAWIQVVQKGLDNVKAVKFVGNGEGAELVISNPTSVFADQEYDLDVSFEGLTLSHPNGTYVNDLGHTTNYFATALRNTNAKENTVTYTNCTFPNGVCNNSYGNTVFTSCKFTSTAGKYGLWVYGGSVEVDKSSFSGARGVKTYTETKDLEVVETELSFNDVSFSGITEKAAVVVSKAANVEMTAVNVENCEKGLLQKAISNTTYTIEANGSNISGKFNVTGTNPTEVAKTEFNISSGEFTKDSKIDEKYYAENVTITPNEDGTFGVDLTDYVVVGGIAGFEKKKFASFEEAYNAIKPTIEKLGLGQESASATAFDAIFTDRDENGNAKLTYTIKGNVVYDETGLSNLLTMGRKASHYGNDRHLIKFAFVGVTADKKDTLTVNSNITLPYEWWGEKFTTSISFENLTITGSAPSGLYPSQPYFEGIDFTVNNCTLKGIKIYNCANVGGSYTITNSVLDGTGAAANAYAIHLQGNETAPLTINISGNTISGYDRGVNIDQATANATISDNTISVKDAKRSCIQLTQLAETTIADNNLNLTGGNAITLHSNLAEGSKITVKANTIAGNGYLIYDDTQKAIDLTYGENTVAATVDKTKGVYGDTTKDLSDDVYNEVHHVLAEVNGVKFATLAEAIAAAKAGDTVTLLADATEDVVVDKNITLDLGGNTLTGTNSGKATVSIRNGATTTVKNGSIIGSNSYYTIEIIKGSNATATFEDLTATAGNTGSSMIDNWGTLTIKSGTYTGGLNVVKSEEGSKLTINGGKFTLAHSVNGYTGVVFTYGDTTITGGEFIQSLTTHGRWNHPQVVLTGVVEGYTAITRVTGGSFTNKSSEGIFHGVGKATSDNFEVSGGTFNKSISEGFCADGFIPTKQADGTYGVKEGKYVAKIGSKNYETLADAIRLAAKGKTVTLLDNISGNFEIASAKNITLDLNGFTLNGGTGTAKAAITNHGTLTITDSSAKKTGTIKRDDSGIVGETSYYVIRNFGTMTIEQANVINNSGSKGSSLIDNIGDEKKASLTIKNGHFEQQNFIAIKNDSFAELTVIGGEIVSKQSAIQNWCDARITGGKITGQIWTDAWQESSIGKTVIDGTVEFTGEIVMDVTNDSIEPKLTINGGNLSVTNWRITKACAALGGKPAVSGGTFANAVPAEYCADRFIPTQNADGTYGVKACVAKVGSTKYETLAEAIAAAKDGDTITLLANVADFEGAEVTKNLTFDFGDYTITGKTGATVLHVKNAKVTLNGKTGGIDGGAGGDNIAVRANTGAEVIINGGVYTVGADANGLGNSTVYVTDNGKVTINGGTFSSKAAYNGKYYVLNVQNSAKGTFVVKGGTFKDFDPLSGDDNLGGNFAPEGYGANRDENGNFTIVAGVVAQVKNASGKSVKAYATLEEALNAAQRKAIVMLLADTEENVTIAKELTLDLNGHTINGGTVNGKPAVTVTARVTIKDSSEAQTGTIMREDTAENSGVSSYYVIDVQGDGWLTFEGGNVINHSGVVGVRGASLVRVGDDSVAEYPGLNIKGGTFTQDNFIAIKVDRGDLFLNGGTVNSANSYAIEDWHRATVKGGTVNGAVAAWAYSGGLNSTLEISGGTINGDVTSVNYGNATDKKATVSVTGGTINGKLDTRSYDPATGDLTSINDAAKATIGVSGGTFSIDPSKYVVEESAITENADGTYGVEKAYLVRVGNTSYYTMDEAFKAQTASGEAIVMLRDYTTGSTFNSGSIHRVVDLNGHTWTYTGTDTNSAAFEINYSNATLTVKNGTIISSTIVGLIPSAMGGTIKYDNSGIVFDTVIMTSNGSSGIETNGNNTNDSVTLKNSTLNVPNGFGIYFPSSGTLTIDNSKITAKTMGVQVCSGELNINAGSVITVKGDAVPKAENDGAIQDGAAISIVNRTGYKGLSNIVITGGTFTAKAGNDAIKAYDWNNAENKGSDFTKADLVAVSGGTFSSEVKKDYLADRFVVNKNTNGTYGVTAGSGFAGANVVVTESLAMKVVVGTASKYVVVTYKGLDGIAKTVSFDKFTDIKIEDKDYKYCLFDQIMPQMIDVKFSFELYGENDVMLDRKANYSVIDYLADIIASEKDSAEFRNVAASLIEYANRAKVVKGLATIAPEFVKGTEKVDLTELYKTFIADEKNKIPAKDTVKAEDISNGDAQVIYKAKVVFDDAYTLTFYTNDNEKQYTYKLDDKVIVFDENGKYTVNVLAQNITTKYVLTVYDKDSKLVQTVTYGVSTYCIRMQETETPQGELYVASYYYGVAVNQYGTANPNSVQG